MYVLVCCVFQSRYDGSVGIQREHDVFTACVSSASLTLCLCLTASVSPCLSVCLCLSLIIIISSHCQLSIELLSRLKSSVREGGRDRQTNRQKQREMGLGKSTDK